MYTLKNSVLGVCMKEFKSILIVEFKNCIKSEKISFIFWFMILMVAIGKRLDSGQCVYAIKPLLIMASIVYLNSLLVEYNSGVYKNIITRVQKRKYLIAKFIVIFTIVFVVVFIILSALVIFKRIIFPC